MAMEQPPANYYDDGACREVLGVCNDINALRNSIGAINGGGEFGGGEPRAPRQWLAYRGGIAHPYPSPLRAPLIVGKRRLASVLGIPEPVEVPHLGPLASSACAGRRAGATPNWRCRYFPACGVAPDPSN